MTAVPLLITILAIGLVKGTPKDCSKLETVRINFQEPIIREFVTQKETQDITKIRYEHVIDTEVIVVYWESSYCPPVEYGLFTDCKQKLVTPTIEKGNLELYELESMVLVPGSCEGGICDGQSEEACLSPELSRKVPVPFTEVNSLSSSWLHYRCARSITTLKFERQAYVTMGYSLKHYITIPDVGHCETPTNKSMCSPDGIRMIISKNNKSPQVTITNYPCITDQQTLVCYDPIEHVQFIIETGKCDILQGLTYCIAGAHNLESYLESMMVVEIGTIDMLSHQLIYENMEISFQTTLLKTQVKQLRQLVISMLLHQYNLVPDPLQHLLGFGLTNLQMERESISGSICYPSYPKGSPTTTKKKVTKELTLSPSQGNSSQYEDFKMGLTFLKSPPPYTENIINFTKIHHGNAPLVKVGSLLDFILPDFLKDILTHFVTYLTIFNTVLLLFTLRR